MRLTGATETRRVLISLLAATTLHGALFVAIGRLSPPMDDNESPGRDALRIEVSFARPVAASRTQHDERESATDGRRASTPLDETPLPPPATATAGSTGSLTPDGPIPPAANGNALHEPASSPQTPTDERLSSFTHDTDDLPERDIVSGDTADRSSADRSVRSTLSAAGTTDAIPTIEPERYVEPRYPEAARRAGLEGTVALRLSVNGRGRVVSASITETSGVRALDTEALRAARLWRFPRGADDRESAHRIRFSLEEQ